MLYSSHKNGKRFDEKMNTKVIMVCNNKGGVGKTTCAAAIADVLARKMNLPTLIVDADPQGNISSRFGYRPEFVSVKNSLDVCLFNEFKSRDDSSNNESIPIEYFFNDCKFPIQLGDDKKYDNLKIICASSTLEKIIAMYFTMPQKFEGLWNNVISKIKNLNQFEYVIIDTQPNLSYFLSQIMMASDYVIVPVEPTEDSFSGAKAIGNVFNSVANKKRTLEIDNKINFLGVVFNKWRLGTIAARKFEKELTKIWGNNPIFKTKIPANQDAINAANLFAPVTLVKPYSSSASAFRNLVREVVEKID